MEGVQLFTSGVGGNGPSGPTGPAGPSGPSGPTGPVSTVPGPSGPTGPQGPVGTFGGNGFSFTFSTDTTDSDPGNGFIKFNNATYGDVSEIYVDLVEAGGTDITAWLNALADANNDPAAVLKMFSQAEPTRWATFTLTSVTSAVGYRKLAVTPVASSSAFTLTVGDTNLIFAPAGNRGDTGPPGTGPEGDPGDIVFLEASQIGSVDSGVFTYDSTDKRLTVRKIVGGTGTTQTLIFQPTTGVGATGADIIFKVGNNGATEALRLKNDGSALFSGTVALGANNLTMTGSIASTGNRVTKGWFIDLEVTNAIVGSITGNAATASAATTLVTTHTIGGSNFNGSQDVTSFPAPGAIGGGTPAAGTFTALTGTSGSLAGLTTLAIRDTSAAFDVTLAATSSTTLTAGRTLTFDLADAARTIKLVGNPTLANWFDQNVKAAASPTFVTVTANLAGNATTATALATSRNLWGQAFTGAADVTGSLTDVADITGGASSMLITAGTGNSRTLTIKTTSSGGVALHALMLDATQGTTVYGDLFFDTSGKKIFFSDTSLGRSAAGKMAISSFAIPLSANAQNITFAGLTAARTYTLPDTDSTLLYSGGPLGTPSSGTVTNLTGTASININGTVGATTPAAGTFTSLHATGSVIIDGDLLVSGDAFEVDTASMVVEDPLIKLATANGADAVDIGFYGLYTSSGAKYTGLFRDATDGKWKLFSSLQSEPTTTVNTAGTGYAVATLVANVEGAVTGNATTATTLATSRNIWGQAFTGAADVTGSLTGVQDITGGATSMIITSGTGNSRTLTLKTTTAGGVATTALTLNADQSATFANTVNATTFVGALTGNASTATSATSATALSVSGQSGLLTVTGLTSTNRAKTVRDAADTILELGGSYTPTGVWTNLPLTTPKITTHIGDANGNEAFIITATASAVNEVTFANAATGGTPTFTASGGDSNVGMVFMPKGTGTIRINQAANLSHFSMSDIKLQVAGSSGNYTAYFKGNAASGNSFGVVIEAGTTSTDAALNIRDQANNNTFFSVLGNFDVVVGGNTLGTTATAGFLYIPQCAGPPTGVPALSTNCVPLVVDSTNSVFYLHTAAGWIGSANSAGTQTFTNKTMYATTNVVEEITSTSSSSTPTPTGGSLRNFFKVTAQAATGAVAAPSGTPADGNIFTIRIKASGTQTLSWDSSYRAIGVTLPLSIASGKTIYLTGRYNSADSKYDVLGVAIEA